MARNRKVVPKVIATPEWTVTAQCTNGAVDKVWEFETEQEARGYADWAHNSPGFMNVELTGPVYSGPRHYPTAADEQVGGWLAAALEDRKVSPCMKLDINRWMDSKAWPDTTEEASV
jgi:hypothetical protein